MQVECTECGKVGLLQKITPRYFRIRHSTVTHHIALFGRPYNRRNFSYCRVSTEWAEHKIKEEQLKEETELRELLSR
jgi:hypothetical protein